MDFGSGSSPTSQNLPPRSTSPNLLDEESSPMGYFDKGKGSHIFEGPEPHSLPRPPSPSESLPSTVHSSEAGDDDLLQPGKPSFFPFLDLPGELRNRVYRYCLVFEKPFIVKFRFGQCDTGLLLVCRQIYEEAGDIFYQENKFRFPQAVFDGEDIFTKLDTFFRIPACMLASLKDLHIEIPVYVNQYPLRFRIQLMLNSRRMVAFLARFSSPGTKIHVVFSLPDHEIDDRKMETRRLKYGFFLGWIELREELIAKCDYHVTVHTHPKHLAEWINHMQGWFNHRVTVIARGIAMPSNAANTVRRQRIIEGFRLANYDLIKRFYAESWNGTRYAITPRETVS